MAKLLREKYKTWEGARKRAAFENGIAGSEFRNGYKAKHYRYTAIQEGETYRVARLNPNPALDALRQYTADAIARGEQPIVETRE